MQRCSGYPKIHLNWLIPEVLAQSASSSEPSNQLSEYLKKSWLPLSIHRIHRVRITSYSTAELKVWSSGRLVILPDRMPLFVRKKRYDWPEGLKTKVLHLMGNGTEILTPSRSVVCNSCWLRPEHNNMCWLWLMPREKHRPTRRYRASLHANLLKLDFMCLELTCTVSY